jgi:hypothetical protein
MLHSAAQRTFLLTASGAPLRAAAVMARVVGNHAQFHCSAAHRTAGEALCMPHSHISTTKDSEKFLLRLLDRLWEK